MKRTTIFVPEALERDLQLYAQHAGKPTAAVVREALAAYIAQRRPATELPSFAAAFDSGRTDTAEHHEEILFKRVSPHGPAHAPKRAPRKKTAARTRTAKRR
jgi:predicted transcriptional regulator